MASPEWTIVLLRDGRRSRPWHADVAQLVAHHLAKVRVAGSNPVIRSKVQEASTPAVEWPSGEATACKAVHTGSIPVSTSSRFPARLAQRESASLTRKRSLVQSQYRAPCFTQISPGLTGADSVCAQYVPNEWLIDSPVTTNHDPNGASEDVSRLVDRVSDGGGPRLVDVSLRSAFDPFSMPATWPRRTDIT